jgi:hypothetical protein
MLIFIVNPHQEANWRFPVKRRWSSIYLRLTIGPISDACNQAARRQMLLRLITVMGRHAHYARKRQRLRHCHLEKDRCPRQQYGFDAVASSSP